ncbi:hypothetical protein [Dapis sp. BLCC M172]|uniref:hypothetical protein n=1 Tax=Dapis sp. BLCC M172 TaxID=2975281 RepID=UPI003CF5A889
MSEVEERELGVGGCGPGGKCGEQKTLKKISALVSPKTKNQINWIDHSRYAPESMMEYLLMSEVEEREF